MTDLFRLRLRNASTVVPARVEWLWEGRIPLGVLSLLVGPAGRGKSTLAYDLAARVTRGQLGHRPANVIVATSEDSLAHTSVPRLLAAGADLERVDFASINEHESERGLTLPDDLPDLEDAIRGIGASLVVLDPVVSHISGEIDSHKDHSVRRALDPISKLAERTGAAVLGIGHLNKSASSDVLHRLIGSVGFGAAARSVLLFAEKPDEPEGTAERVLLHGKCNLAPLAPGLRLAVEGRSITFEGEEIETSGLIWKGEDPTLTAAAVLAGPQRDERRPERDIAREVILDALTDSEQRWVDLVELLTDEGVSKRTGERARDGLRADGLIESYKDGRGPWLWKLATLPWRSSSGEVPKGALTRGNAPPNGELLHTRETGEVPDSSPWDEQVQSILEYADLDGPDVRIGDGDASAFEGRP
jgi:hypothetical protein